MRLLDNTLGNLSCNFLFILEWTVVELLEDLKRRLESFGLFKAKSRTCVRYSEHALRYSEVEDKPVARDRTCYSEHGRVCLVPS